jgi:hypothetical protein
MQNGTQMPEETTLRYKKKGWKLNSRSFVRLFTLICFPKLLDGHTPYRTRGDGAHTQSLLDFSACICYLTN